MAQALAIAGSIGGGILNAGSLYNQGQAASRMGNIQANSLEESATQLDTSANAQEGGSQLKAKETKRQTKLLQSRIIALAAAGGGGVGEKNVNDILLNVEGEGEYRALMDLYNGSSAAYELRSRANSLRNNALISRFEGKQTRRAANMAAFGSILSSSGNAASFASKYNTGNTGNTSIGSTPTYGNDNMPNTTLQVDYSKFK